MKKYLFLIIITTLLLAGCTASAQPLTAGPLTKLSLPMGYIPSVQYAP